MIVMIVAINLKPDLDSDIFMSIQLIAIIAIIGIHGVSRLLSEQMRQHQKCLAPDRLVQHPPKKR